MVLERIAELKTLSTDVTKSTTDVANYDKEFTALKAQLTSVAAEKFNGVAIFGGGSLTVETSEDGSQTLNVTAKAEIKNLVGFRMRQAPCHQAR